MKLVDLMRGYATGMMYRGWTHLIFPETKGRIYTVTLDYQQILSKWLIALEERKAEVTSLNSCGICAKSSSSMITSYLIIPYPHCLCALELIAVESMLNIINV